MPQRGLRCAWVSGSTSEKWSKNHKKLSQTAFHKYKLFFCLDIVIRSSLLIQNTFIVQLNQFIDKMSLTFIIYHIHHIHHARQHQLYNLKISTNNKPENKTIAC